MRPRGERQHYRIPDLNLLTAIIVYWNTLQSPSLHEK